MWSISTEADFLLLQYMGSFPVAIPDIANRAEYVRSQLETLRVSTLSNNILSPRTVRSSGKEILGSTERVSR